MHGAWKRPRPGPGKFPELWGVSPQPERTSLRPLLHSQGLDSGIFAFLSQSPKGEGVTCFAREVTGSRGAVGFQGLSSQGVVGHSRYEHVRAALLRTPVRTRTVWVDGNFPCLLSFADCIHV